MQVRFESGDLIKFGRVSRLAHLRHLNNKTAVYIETVSSKGSRNFLDRPGSTSFKYHKILVSGELTPSVIDDRWLIHMLAQKLDQTNP